MKPIAFGIIGGGEIGHNRALPGFQRARGVRLATMADLSDTVRRQWEMDAPEVRRFANGEELLADREIEAVYLGLPNHLHREWTLKAAQAGKHVLCEKPLALNAAEGREMAEACERAGVILMAGYMTTFCPLVQELHGMLRAGRLGELRYVRGRFAYTTGPKKNFWRMDPEKGGGPLFDVGIYIVFMIRHLTGQTWRSVLAQGSHRWWKDHPIPDTVLVLGELADGTPVCVETAFTFGGNHILIEGERGTLTIDNVFTQVCQGRLSGAIDGTRMDLEIDPRWTFAEQNYQFEFEHLAECIRERKEPVSSGRVAIQDCAVLDAIVESVKTGRRVEVRCE